MPQLDPSSFSSQLFWLAVFFAVLYVLLARFLLPRVQTVIDLRAKTIGDDINRAESSKAQAEQARDAYEKSLAEVRAKSKSMIAQSREKSAESTAKRQTEMDAMLEKQTQESEQSIEKAKKDIMGKLLPVASELAGNIVNLLVSRKPDAGEIDAVLRKLGKGGTA
jgi:F-type H+-transporting ATPase subunit b